MIFKTHNVEDYSIAKVASGFTAGAGLGTFLLLIPYSLSALKFNLHDVGIAALVIIVCGLVSIFLGKRFIEAIMRSLESSVF